MKLTHAAFVFMEELSGGKEKLTAVPLDISIEKELLATSWGS